MSWLTSFNASRRCNKNARRQKQTRPRRPRPSVELLEARLTPSAPTIVSLTPPDDAAEVAVNANLQIQFSENVQKGSGNVVIRRLADQSVVQTIPVASAQVTVSGTTVTIDPSPDLADNTAYYVQIDAGAFVSTRKLLVSENFEGSGGTLNELRPFVSTSESLGNGTDWTDQLPANWRRDNTTTPAPTAGDNGTGPVEFFGWNILDKVSWGATASDQDRSSFTRGRGNVIVADGDEYDDLPPDIDPNLMNVFLITPSVALAGTVANSVTLEFDSSYRPFDTQTGTVDVSFDGGTTWTNVLTLNNANSGGEDSLSRANEHLTLTVNNPATGTMQIRFGYLNAGNDWWWALDNVVVRANATAGNGDAFAGISASTAWNFSTGGLALTTLSPADNAVNVEVNANLVLTFDDNVRVGPGSGNILIRRVVDDSIVQAINVASPRVTFSGNTVTIDPPNDLPDKATFYVQIDPGAIRDQSNDVGNTTLFRENFEGLVLGRFPNEPYVSGQPVGTVRPGVVGDGTDFTKTPPLDWSIDNGQMPTGGVPEWRGWTFADRASWNDVDGGQFRADFARGTGTVAVADADEWNDASNTTGQYQSFLVTPNISLVGTVANSVTLAFDSSFRPLGQQKALVDVSFNGGTTWTNVLTKNSGSLTAGDRAFTNEHLTITVNNPTSGTVRFRFGLIDAADDYWWAIDNLEVRANVTGNPFAGITDRTSWNFATRDITPPRILSLTPPDDGFGPVDTNLIITFDELVQRGTGNILLRRFTDDSTVEMINITSAQVTLSGTTLTINPANDLVFGTQYYVLIDAGALRDLAPVPNLFSITNKNTWNFTAGDLAAPVVMTLTPADDATAVPVGANLVVRFNENVRVGPGTGFIVIRRVSDDGVVASVNVNSSRVTFSGNTVTIDPPNDLPANTTLYVQFDHAAVRDLSARELNTFLLREDFERTFENPKLGPFREETGGDGTDWTNVPPFAWTIDNSRDGGVPGVNEPAENNGVFDWAGWAFADRETWVTVAGDQRRSEFARGTGTVAIADPDEWDDAPHPDGTYNTYLSAPRVYLTEVRLNSLQLKFDSSWRPEGFDDAFANNQNNQTAVIRFIYNRGLTGEQTVEVLRWDSDPSSATYHDHAPNEAITLNVTAPAGAQTIDIEFGLLRAANDWWWAIDNVELTGTMVGNPFAGILDTRTVWNFTTASAPGGGNPPPTDPSTDPILPTDSVPADTVGKTIAVTASLVPSMAATINAGENAGFNGRSGGAASVSVADLVFAVIPDKSVWNFLTVPVTPVTFAPTEDGDWDTDMWELLLPLAGHEQNDEGGTPGLVDAGTLDEAAFQVEAPFELAYLSADPCRLVRQVKQVGG